MRALFEQSVLAGMGLLSMTHEKAQKIVDELTRRGEVQKDEVKDWVDRLVQRGDEERQSLRKLIHDEVKSALDVSEIDETTFSQYLYCQNIPDVDLILRTGGE
jgi:polyhydroxyalkanoate synthesis regulator phasin